MYDQFRFLFSPITIGNVVIPNRIFFTAHVTRYISDPMDSGERQAHYFAERAKGGVGLIALMDPPYAGYTASLYSRMPEAARAQVLRRNRLTTDLVHQHGGKIFAQICHGTGRQHTNSRRPEAPVVSASPVPCPTTRFIPHELEIEEIESLITQGAELAVDIREAGFDGIELHSSHAGYIIQQFLSPYSNKRTDEYGGSLENRMRFLFRCLKAIRNAVGRDYVVGLRLGVDEFVPNGLTLDEGKEIARHIEASGMADYLSVDPGNYKNSRILIFPDSSFPLGFASYLAAEIRAAAPSLPIVASHRIADPLLAERILAEGQADMVGMARPLICDPELPRKAREGRFDDIRRCVACNEGCTARIVEGMAITCIQNPSAGKEKDEGIGIPEPASIRKKVVVVGGGPAGLKAAETAAFRGHDVVLYEKAQEMGGQIALQARVRSRQEYGDIARHLIHSINKLRVVVKLGEEATVESIGRDNPDALIIATGSRPIRTEYTNLTPTLPGLPGADQQNVLTEFDVLNGAETGQTILVVEDNEGDTKAPNVAEFLADQDKQVEIITTASYVGVGVPSANLFTLNRRLMGKGIKFTPYTAVSQIEGTTVHTYNVCTNQAGTIEDVDTVVLTIGHRAETGLYRDLKGKVKEIYLVGDAVAPRRVEDAIREGYQVARGI